MLIQIDDDNPIRFASCFFPNLVLQVELRRYSELESE